MVNVMTYDLYGSWESKIGHHSALFHRKGEKGVIRELNTVCIMIVDSTRASIMSHHLYVIKE